MNENSARRGFWFLIDALLVVFIVAGAFGVQAIARFSNAVPASRTITVSGEGKVDVVPDIAVLTFSVISQGTEPEQLQKENTEKINKAIEFIKAEGIAAKDINTSNYNLYPRYKYDENSGQSNITGYELNQSVTVKVRDFEKTGKIVAGLPSRGINQISGPNFSIEDPEAQKNKAREQAFANARAKADAMARYNGVNIARVIHFSESFGGYPIPMYERAYALGKGGDGSMPVPPTLEPGQQEVTVNVEVTYEIR